MYVYCKYDLSLKYIKTLLNFRSPVTSDYLLLIFGCKCILTHRTNAGSKIIQHYSLKKNIYIYKLA